MGASAGQQSPILNILGRAHPQEQEGGETERVEDESKREWLQIEQGHPAVHLYVSNFHLSRV